MLNKNEIYETTITAYGSEGEGICKINNIAVFVPFGVVGDTLRVRIVKVAKNCAYGKIEEIILPSPERVTPFCNVSDKCGGCDIMHLSYNEQLRFKRQKVQDAISRIAKIPIEVMPVIPADRLAHYRNKVQIPVGENNNGLAITGFYAPKTHIIIENNNCCISPCSYYNITNAIINFINENNISVYNETKKRGIIRHIYIKTASNTDEIMVALVINADTVPHLEKLKKLMLKLFVTTFILNINKKDTNVILGNENLCIFGSGTITDVLCGLKFSISLGSFYQVNHDQTEKLYEIAIKSANITKDDVVFDLYCGIGTISLYAAQFAKEVIGVEIFPEAVENAKNNAKLNNITNADFYCGDAGSVTDKLYKENKKADVVIIDPPRKGCMTSLIDLIEKMAPKKIVYISCNPATLARDLAYFKIYKPIFIRPVDMFVNTNHVETVVLLSRVDK